MKVHILIVANIAVALVLPAVAIPLVLDCGSKATDSIVGGIAVCVIASSALLVSSLALSFLYHPPHRRRAVSYILYLGVIAFFAEIVIIPWAWFEEKKALKHDEMEFQQMEMELRKRLYPKATVRGDGMGSEFFEPRDRKLYNMPRKPGRSTNV